MSLLSALLTQDQVVSPKAIDEAIQRQVISGGDFETNLLEVGAIGEDTLAGYCAVMHGLQPVARGELLRAAPDALARLPAMLVERHQALPLRVERGRLVVAVAAPLVHSARVELEVAARLPLDPRCVTSARLSWALARYFAVPLAPRLQRLVAKLDTAPPGPLPGEVTVPLTRPRAGGRTSVPSAAPSAAIAAFDAAIADDDPSRASPLPPRVAPAAFLASVGADPSSVRTVVPTASSPPSTANTQPLKRDTRTLPMEFAPPPLPGPSSIPHRAPILPSAVPPSTAPAPIAKPLPYAQASDAAPRPAPLTPPSTRPLPQDRRPSSPEAAPTLRAEPFTTPAPPPTMTSPLGLNPPPRPAPRPPSPSLTRPPAPSPPVTAPPSVTPSVRSPLRATTPPPDVTLSLAPVTVLPPQMDNLTAARALQGVLPGPARMPQIEAPTAPRGIPLDEALRRLERADDRDAVVDVLLDHAHERFAYVALLMVQGKHCAGVASRGAGASGAALRDLSITLERPSILRLAHDSSNVEVASVEAGTSDAEVRARLQRSEAREAVVVPVRIGAKVALLLWVDNGASSPSALAVRQLEAFAQRCAEVFARIIAARKRTVSGPRGRPSPASGVSVARAQRAPLPDRSARLDALRKAVGPAVPSARAPEPVQAPAQAVAPRVEASAAPRAPDASDELVEAVLRADSLSDTQLATLLAGGDRALDAVFARFPGPHNLRRGDALTRLPSLSEAGVLLRVVVAFRHAALPRLLAALDGADPDGRYCALLCLGEVVHASAIPALLPKLTDSDYPTRMVAIEVLRNYRRFEGFDAVGASLRAALRDTRGAADVRRAAAHALGELRDAESIEVLAASLAEGDASLATAAHRALVVITRQDFGTAPAPWLAWWVSAAPRHRIEWLIDALLHAEPTIRHEASEELKRLTGQYFGYYFNLPRRERERGHERYVAWWKSDGAQRFGAASGGA